MRERGKLLLGRQPQLVARLELYSPGRSPRKGPLLPGFGCPCYGSTDYRNLAWDCLLLLGDQEMQLGAIRDVGFIFLSGDQAVRDLTSHPRFYLWEVGFIGEAVPIDVDLGTWRP